MGSMAMAGKLSLVVFILLTTLTCLLAKRGRGGQNFRTEEDRRQTRRKLAAKMDPRRVDKEYTNNIQATGEEDRSMFAEKSFKQPITTILTTEDNKIFLNLLSKETYNKEQENKKVTEKSTFPFVNNDTMDTDKENNIVTINGRKKTSDQEERKTRRHFN